MVDSVNDRASSMLHFARLRYTVLMSALATAVLETGM